MKARPVLPGVTHASEIDALVEQFLTNHDPEESMKPLMVALGCTHVPYLRVKRPLQPGPEYEHVVVQTLISAMHTLAMNPDRGSVFLSDVYAILSGLSKHNRWQLCAGSAENIHAFATLLSFFDERCWDWIDPNFVQINHACIRLQCAVEPDLCAMLNEWIRPATPYKKAPPADVLAQTLFGAAWCSIVLDAEDGPWEVAKLIRETCPTLVPAMMLEALSGATIELPVLDGYDC